MTKLTGLFPAISLVPAGMVVRMMFLPRLLILIRQEGGGGGVSIGEQQTDRQKILMSRGLLPSSAQFGTLPAQLKLVLHALLPTLEPH